MLTYLMIGNAIVCVIVFFIGMVVGSNEQKDRIEFLENKINKLEKQLNK